MKGKKVLHIDRNGMLDLLCSCRAVLTLGPQIITEGRFMQEIVRAYADGKQRSCIS